MHAKAALKGAPVTLQLGSDVEARIQERINSGKYATPTDVVLAGLQLLAERDQTQAADLETLRKKIAHGFEQLERGESHDGEAVFAELLAELEDAREDK